MWIEYEINEESADLQINPKRCFMSSNPFYLHSICTIMSDKDSKE